MNANALLPSGRSGGGCRGRLHARRVPNGQAVHAYVANSNRGTWLFQPSQDNGNG
jgi:hypothetical protein